MDDYVWPLFSAVLSRDNNFDATGMAQWGVAWRAVPSLNSLLLENESITSINVYHTSMSVSNVLSHLLGTKRTVMSSSWQPLCSLWIAATWSHRTWLGCFRVFVHLKVQKSFSWLLQLHLIKTICSSFLMMIMFGHSSTQCFRETMPQAWHSEAWRGGQFLNCLHLRRRA